MNFASDNTAGMAPEILNAITCANDGFVLGYGNDDQTKRVERRIGEIFERDCAVFLVPTGTAANALALAHVSPPWSAVFTHNEAHIVTDECGAPEFFGNGLKLIGLPGVGCKIAPDTLAAALAPYHGHAPHQVIPSAISFSQASEGGTIYRPDEIAALAEIAHARGMKVHMDGARLANALMRFNASPAQATWQAGVDVLLVRRHQGRRDGRGGGGVLRSRARLADGRASQAGRAIFCPSTASWRRSSRPICTTIAGCGSPATPTPWPIGSRRASPRSASSRLGRSRRILVFVVLPKAVEERLKAAGARYYVRSSDSLPGGARVEPQQVLIRLVTSFATRESEVDRFVELAAKA